MPCRTWYVPEHSSTKFPSGQQEIGYSQHSFVKLLRHGGHAWHGEVFFHDLKSQTMIFPCAVLAALARGFLGTCEIMNFDPTKF